MVHSSSRLQTALQRGTRVVLRGSVVSKHGGRRMLIAFAVGLDALMRSGWRKEGDRV